MTIWEYRRTLSSNDAEMAQMGRDGWELVAVTPGIGLEQGYFFWKRPKGREAA